MAIRKRGCIIRSTAILAAAIAALICGTSRNALAISDGCKAWNKIGKVMLPAYQALRKDDFSDSWTINEHINISSPNGQTNSALLAIMRNNWNYRMSTNGGSITITVNSLDFPPPYPPAWFGYAIINYTQYGIPFTFSCGSSLTQQHQHKHHHQHH